MRIAPPHDITTHLALKSQKPRKTGAWLKRGTEESNLALRFWRPPCYRYTSPPASRNCRGSRAAATTRRAPGRPQALREGLDA
jgi:hypothetical protein